MLAESGRLLHFANDERAYIASQRFLLPETDSLLFLVVRGGAALVVPETAFSPCS